jgi:hypothetical protein
MKGPRWLAARRGSYVRSGSCPRRGLLRRLQGMTHSAPHLWSPHLTCFIICVQFSCCPHTSSIILGSWRKANHIAVETPSSGYPICPDDLGQIGGPLTPCLIMESQSRLQSSSAELGRDQRSRLHPILLIY